MPIAIAPAARLDGEARLPGDKSVSHRAAMLASIAEGRSTLVNYSTGADCASTLGCVEALGAGVSRDGTTITIEGHGLDGLREPLRPLDAGNSGSTIRMLSGILAGQPFATTLFGDESLSKRPMQRIMAPLAQMGATVEARDGKFPPIVVRGARPLQAIDYTPPVASAQVKTCVLFAGLYAGGVTTVRESIPTRDHTEMALREFGADVTIVPGSVSVQGRPRLAAREFHVPGDLSSAAFLLVAASLVPGSRILIEGVGLNPSRTALLDYLMGLGANVRVAKIGQVSGEMAGDLEVRYAPTRAGVIEGALAAALIDEIPVLAILGAAAGGLTVRDAGELRVKETDRIAALEENFRRAGVAIETRPDGFTVAGGQKFRQATFDSLGDHRIAMAFSVASLVAEDECAIENHEAASVSFPEFYKLMKRLRR
ncbi:MAG: 3-phosphoshikimate 1-carboxyvinyltransferase [Bryobacteraceae bacterium]|nr:3-phosphoshikimate 1-carboxyvinyltransferase [Bryobacteraceae bacterium]